MKTHTFQVLIAFIIALFTFTMLMVGAVVGRIKMRACIDSFPLDYLSVERSRITTCLTK